MSNEPAHKYTGLITAQVSVTVVGGQTIFDDARTNAAEKEQGSVSPLKPNLARRALTNTDAANPIFIGPAGVTILNGHKIAAGQTFEVTGPGGMVFLGAVFGIAVGGTVVVSTWEN